MNVTRGRVRSNAAAGHEAAHAVVATLSGLMVRRAAISVTAREWEGGAAGLTAWDPPVSGWPVPLSTSAHGDAMAAGYAWDRLWGRTDAWDHAATDRRSVGSPVAWEAAVARVDRLLQDEAILDAIEDVEDRIIGRASGQLPGPALERMLGRLGLIPAFDRAEVIATARSAA